MEAQHSGRYCKWAADTKFELKLPGDIKKCKEAANQVTQTLDCDFKEKKLLERLMPYTDKNFHQAAIEWLVATDQVSNASTV